MMMITTTNRYHHLFALLTLSLLSSSSLLSHDQDGSGRGIVGVEAISPYPVESFPAISYWTDDGQSTITAQRRVTDVVVGFVGSDQDPVEETVEGYSVVYSKTSESYEYAIIDTNTGDLIPSGIKVQRGVTSPPSTSGIPKHVRRTVEGKAFIAKTDEPASSGGSRTRHLLSRPSSLQSHIQHYETWNEQVETYHRQRLLQAQPQQLKLLVVPIRFSNHASRTLPTIQQLSTLFNNDVSEVFDIRSHGNLVLTADVVNDWIDLSNTESYYSGGKRGYDATKMHEAIREALDYLESEGFDFSQYDVNNDGLVDGIMFVHSGYGAEFGGLSEEDNAYYMDRIWSHHWTLFEGGWTSSTHNIKVQNYPLVSGFYGKHTTSNSSSTIPMVRVGVIAHELTHFLGMYADTVAVPSLDDVHPTSWDLMTDGWGFSGNQACPPLLNPWTLLQLGWLNDSNVEAIGRLDSGSSYTMIPSYDAQSTIYQISDGYDVNEYLLLEFRHKGSSLATESCLPSKGGLAIWHVDEAGSGGGAVVSLIQADDTVVEPDESSISSLIDFNTNTGDVWDLFDTTLGKDMIGPSGIGRLLSGESIPMVPNTDSKNGFSSGVTLSVTEFDSTLAQLTFSLVYSPTSLSMAPSISGSPTISPTTNPTWNPIISDSPTVSFAPNPYYTAEPTRALTIPASCSDPNQALFVVELTTDLHGDELTWTLMDTYRGPQVYRHGGPYSANQIQLYRYGVCLDKATCWGFALKDEEGNGLNLTQGSGSNVGYKVKWNGSIIDQSPTSSNGNYPQFNVIGSHFGTKCTDFNTNTMRDQTSSLSSDILSNGIMFDVIGDKSIIFHVLKELVLASKAGVTSTQLKVYTKQGSYQGYETTSSVWTLQLTQTITEFAGPEQYSYFWGRFSTKFAVPLGSTIGFYVVLDQPVMYSTDCANEVILNGSSSPQMWRTLNGYTITSGILMKQNFAGPERTLQGDPIVACVDWRMRTYQSNLLPAVQFPTESPTTVPTTSPSAIPSETPSLHPSSKPSNIPSVSPVASPSTSPSSNPTSQPSSSPSTVEPTSSPSRNPSSSPSHTPTGQPTFNPSSKPSTLPSVGPSNIHTVGPSVSMEPSSSPSTSQVPTTGPPVEFSHSPSSAPSSVPTSTPSSKPSTNPSSSPSEQPSTTFPSPSPSKSPSSSPSVKPSSVPSSSIPTTKPSVEPSVEPSVSPVHSPSSKPSGLPSHEPTNIHTVGPSISMKPSSSPSTSQVPTTGPPVEFSHSPSSAPSDGPTFMRSSKPSVHPSGSPSGQPSTEEPTPSPSNSPSSAPTTSPSHSPSSRPSGQPSTTDPSPSPSDVPSSGPTNSPSHSPSVKPSSGPSSSVPTVKPSVEPSVSPIHSPSSNPSSLPSLGPSNIHTVGPSVSMEPSSPPSTSQVPTTRPPVEFSHSPSSAPSDVPTSNPSNKPSVHPSGSPSEQPSTTEPTPSPSSSPSSVPTNKPSSSPIDNPTNNPSSGPSSQPTNKPSVNPSSGPSGQPSTSEPSPSPSSAPSSGPSNSPSSSPTSSSPTKDPSSTPSKSPSSLPSGEPSHIPTSSPTDSPVASPSHSPSVQPSSSPTVAPTVPLVTCGDTEKLLKLKLKTDVNADKLTWDVVDVYNNGAVMASGGPYAQGQAQTVEQELCLSNDGCYRYVLRDSAGDGLANDGQGASVTWGGKVEMEPVIGFQPSFSATGVDFGGSCLASNENGFTDMGLNGRSTTDRIMFDVQANDDVMLRRFHALHIQNKKLYNYRVYTKNGSFRGYENDIQNWTMIHNSAIEGSGRNSYSYTQGVFNLGGAVPVLKDTVQAFYIILDDTKLVWNYVAGGTDAAGQTVCYSDDTLKVIAGLALDGFTWQAACLDGIINFAPVAKKFVANRNTLNL